jgi:hypothetical protein
MKNLLTALGFILPLAAFGASRSSANYNVAADTIDAGGRRATSAGYSNDGSVGGIGGISSGGAPQRLAKHGYIGQLYEVAGLTLFANPSTVNEGATRQLAGSALADDATTLSLNPSQISWSVISGPITSVSPGGLATAAIVYQNTAATVGGSFQGHASTVGLTVVNVGIDDYGAYAGDGLDDAWQVLYFGENNPGAQPGMDPDGDGQDNRHEYFSNTIPTDSLSKFNLSIAYVLGQPNRKDIIFSPRYPSRVYDVEFRTDLLGPAWSPLVGTTTSDAGTTRTVRDLNATGVEKFYRVRISFP